MTDRRVLIISMFLMVACDRTGNAEQQALEAAQAAAARAKLAYDAKVYKEDLSKCREKAKDAGSYDTYELCARDADAKYYRKDGGL